MSPSSNAPQSPKSGQVTELFPYELPFLAARGLSALVLLMALVVGAACVFVRVPETVSAPFVLLPEGGADPLQSAFDGVIEEVRVRAGDGVKAGDTLFTIRSPRIQALSAELREIEQQRETVAARRRAQEDTYAINRQIQEAEIARSAQESAFRAQYLEVYDDVGARVDRLAKEGLASSLEVLNHQLGHAEARRDSALAKEQSTMAKLALSRLEAEHRQALERLAEEEAGLAVRIAGIQEQLGRVVDNLAFVTAGRDGTVISVARQRAGDVVRVGEELCQVAPDTGAPVAHIQLEERGLGRLKEGQPVRLLFEAFPYQRYGAVDGALTWLSPAAVANGEGVRFMAHAAPRQQTIGAGELARSLRSGMRGEARIQTGRRTLLEYVFEPIRQLRENMRSQS